MIIQSRHLIGVFLAFCLPTLANAETTALFFQSQPGDYIGQGQNQKFLATNLTFQVTASASGINVTVRDATFQTFWTLIFTPPAGRTIDNGLYEGAQRAAFKAPGVPGLDVSGDGRGCNTIAGRFLVEDLKKDAKGVITNFALQFEQHCDGRTPALFGQLLFNGTASGLTARVSAGTATARKGNVGTSNADLAISLSRPAPRPVSVNWTTVGGTAKAGIDYMSSSGTVTFTTPQTTQFITVPIIGNRTATGGLKFGVQLSSPVGLMLGASSGTVSISDPNGRQTVLAMNSQPGDLSVAACNGWKHRTTPPSAPACQAIPWHK